MKDCKWIIKSQSIFRVSGCSQEGKEKSSDLGHKGGGGLRVRGSGLEVKVQGSRFEVRGLRFEVQGLRL